MDNLSDISLSARTFPIQSFFVIVEPLNAGHFLKFRSGVPNQAAFKGAAGHVERLAGSHSAVACLATQLRCTWHFRRSEDLRSRALYERTRLSRSLPPIIGEASVSKCSIIYQRRYII